MSPSTDVQQVLDIERRRGEAFERWYGLSLAQGHIPLEFAGAKGKELLERAFTSGGTAALLEVAFMMLTKPPGKEKTP